MYKDRFRKWGIGKNIRSHEKEAVIRKQAQRLQAGKSTACSIRGSRVLDSKIKRYQKATRLFSEEQALRLKTRTPPDLVCWTPLASPLAAPAIFEPIERVAREIQTYFAGCIDSGIWKIADHGELVMTKVTSNSVWDFRDSCSIAFHEFDNGEPKDAWKLLNLAMGLVEQTVSEEDPRTLEILIRLTSWFLDSEHTPGIASTLLNQFSAMSAAVKPKGHPFNQIYSRLLGQDIPHMKHTLAVALQSQMDCFNQRVGRFSWLALRCRSLLPGLSAGDKDAGCIDALWILLREFEQALAASDKRCLYIRGQLAASYLEFNEARKAAEIATSILQIAAAQQITNVGKEILSDAFYYLAHAHDQLSETDLAERNLRQSIVTLVEGYGWEDFLVLSHMSTLGCWLDAWGKVDEAADIRRRRDEIFSSRVERFAMEEEKRFRKLQISSDPMSSGNEQ